VPGHHLAGSNKISYWSSFITFVTSFLLIQSPLPSFFILPLVLSFDLDKKLNYSSPPRLLWASKLVDDRAFFTFSAKCPPILCVFTAKRLSSGIHVSATWRSWLMILLNSTFRRFVCSPNTLPNSACASVRNVVGFWSASIGWINVTVFECRTSLLPTSCCLTICTQQCFAVLWCLYLATLSVPISKLSLSELFIDVSRHDNDSHMLPTDIALHPTPPSLLATNAVSL